MVDLPSVCLINNSWKSSGCLEVLRVLGAGAHLYLRVFTSKIKRRWLKPFKWTVPEVTLWRREGSGGDPIFTRPNEVLLLVRDAHGPHHSSRSYRSPTFTRWPSWSCCCFFKSPTTLLQQLGLELQVIQSTSPSQAFFSHTLGRSLNAPWLLSREGLQDSSADDVDKTWSEGTTT